MNLNLLIHNIGFIISAFATLTALLFLLLNNPREKGHIPLIFTCVAVTTYIVSHVIGVNVNDPDLSRRVLMFNLSNFFIGMFNVHAFLALLGRDKEKKYFIVFIYMLGISLVTWFVFNPYYLFLESVPKMYFPNYYVAGPFDFIRILFLFGLCVPYMFYILVDAYKKTENIYKKSQIKYLTIGFLIAYSVGFIPNLLVYDIHFDPLYGMAFMFLFTIAFLYGAIRYELMNIKVIAKQASVYALIIGFIGLSIILLEYLNNYIISNYPGFPLWVIPSFSILVVMLITLVIWKKIRQVDLLKYEFITTVTHKFRTPLTQIKWSVDNLLKKNFTDDEKREIEYIQIASGKLVELTNLLVAISETDDITYKYRIKKINLNSLIDETVSGLKELVSSKKINIVNKGREDIEVLADESRLKFVMQTFLENAFNYTPSGGEVVISLSLKNDKANFFVRDSGIGIGEKELPYIFTKFYRGDSARSLDTEGMGIGLFISKEIISRHNGRVQVESEGLNKGSTFSFTIPVK